MMIKKIRNYPGVMALGLFGLILILLHSCDGVNGVTPTPECPECEKDTIVRVDTVIQPVDSAAIKDEVVCETCPPPIVVDTAAILATKVCETCPEIPDNLVDITQTVDTSFTYNDQQFETTLTWRLGVGDTNYTLEQWAMLVADSISGEPVEILVLDNIISNYDNFTILNETNTFGSWRDWQDNGDGVLENDGANPILELNDQNELQWVFPGASVITLQNDSIKFPDRSQWSATVRLGSHVGAGMLLRKGDQVSFSITSDGVLGTNIGPNSTCTWNYTPQPYDVLTIQQDVGFCKVYANGVLVTKRTGGSTENAGVDDVYWTVGGGGSTITDVLFLSGADPAETFVDITRVWKIE